MHGSANFKMEKNTFNPNNVCEAMHQMFDQIHVVISSKIDKYMKDLDKRISCIETRISLLRSDCICKVNSLIQSVDEIRSDAAVLDDKRRSVNKAKELIITGIPHYVDEDLTAIFLNIANHLGYGNKDVPIVELQRPRKLNSIPMTSSIVCRFALSSSRKHFFRRYLSKLSLSLADIGYTKDNRHDSGSRIFINEVLSNRQWNIRKFAKKLEKAGRIQKVFLRDGVIFVKIGEHNSAVPCYSKQSLLEKLNPSA